MMPPKYNFVPVHQIESSGRKGEYVTVSPKWGRITFSKDYVNNHQFEGKMIKFYWESEKRLLGWRIVKKSENGFEDISGGIPFVGQEIKTGDKVIKTYWFSITKLIKSVKLQQETYKKLPVSIAKKAIFGEDISYVKL